MGTTLIPPFRTAPAQRDQAIAALGEANRVRIRRASLMRWMHGQSDAHSHERAAELIIEPDRRCTRWWRSSCCGGYGGSDPRTRSGCSPAPRSPPRARLER